MSQHIGTSFGAARALAHEQNINHVEFRLLMRLSESPDGTHFRRSATSFFRTDRMSPDDLFEAVRRLSGWPLYEPIRLEDEVVIWGPF
mgnify:CR=1 FL=1